MASPRISYPAQLAPANPSNNVVAPQDIANVPIAPAQSVHVPIPVLAREHVASNVPDPIADERTASPSPIPSPRPSLGQEDTIDYAAAVADPSWCRDANIDADSLSAIKCAMQDLTAHCVTALRDPKNVSDSVACTTNIVQIEKKLRQLESERQ